MEETKTTWQLFGFVVSANYDGLEVNGQTIPWKELAAAKLEVAQTEFKIPIIGTSK